MDKDLIIYQAEGGAVKVKMLSENGAAWLTMEQMCQLFGENELIIGGHLTSIYAEGELREADTVRRLEGKSYYSLDAALSVGLRVHSKKGQQFRVWAMSILRELILNGVSQ